MQSNQLLNPQLAEIKIQLDAAAQKASSIVNSVSFEQLNERPQPDQWSIAECLVHLNLSSQAELIVLNDAYEQISTKRMYVENQFKMDLLSRFLKWTLEPPPMSIFKIKTTQRFQPVDIEPLSEVLPTFLALQEQLKACVDAANGLPLDQIIVVSPFISYIKYNLLSCFHLLLAHERRHLWQAEKVKKAISQ
ncbi:MAG: DinB family protein [Acidobacteriota bacterium]|nr:DinB family protein [Acidobacteriota bacterium]